MPVERQTGFARRLLPAVAAGLAPAVAPANPPPNQCDPAGTEAERAFNLPCGLPMVAYVTNLSGLRSGRRGAAAPEVQRHHRRSGCRRRHVHPGQAVAEHVRRYWRPLVAA